MSEITQPVGIWNQAELAKALLADVETGSSESGKWINGRIVGLLASPYDSTATDIAAGVSAIPAGSSSPRHSHQAEEIAIILSGSGAIEIGHHSYPVKTGDVVLNPPNVPHRTVADQESPLTVLWVYSRAESALRWLHDGPVAEEV